MAGRDGRWPREIAHLPVCPHRDLPIPFIAEIAPDGTGNFTILDDRRARECLRGRLCAMCGRYMGDEVALIGDEVSLLPGGFWIEPPVCERCGELAAIGAAPGAALCPYLSRQRVPRRTPDDDVAVVGMTPAELADVGRIIPKRPLVMAIARTYTAALAPSHAGTDVMVYQVRPADIRRLRTFGYGPDGRLAETTPAAPPPAPQPRVVRSQRRRTRKR
jgi:hypothetical protein